MKRENEQGNKIPFLFTPIPRFVFEKAFFEDLEYFRFLCFAFHRTAFESKAILHQGHRIELEPFEFVFGRGYWADELGLSQRKIRTFVCQLSDQHLAARIASKSASKYTVYRWLWVHFPRNFCQQICQQDAGRTPANRPQIKNKNKSNIYNIYIKQQQLKVTELGGATQIAAAAFPALVGKAKKLFAALSEAKREAVMALYHKRVRCQPIENPEAWLIKCIEENWLEEEKLELPEPKIEPSDCEKNRVWAQELIQKFEGLPNLHICLRIDFLEVGNMKVAPWQIFLCEPSKAFQRQVKLALKKFGIERSPDVSACYE